MDFYFWYPFMGRLQENILTDAGIFLGIFPDAAGDGIFLAESSIIRRIHVHKANLCVAGMSLEFLDVHRSKLCIDSLHGTFNICFELDQFDGLGSLQKLNNSFVAKDHDQSKRQGNNNKNKPLADPQPFFPWDYSRWCFWFYSGFHDPHLPLGGSFLPLLAYFFQF